MRVAVHDYAGHPFQVDLSRELARRGHEVLHLYSAAITTPRGALAPKQGDPSTLAVEPIQLRSAIDRDRLFSRRRLEAEHGRLVVRRLMEFEPEVVISANAPLESQRQIAAYCSRHAVGFVYWVQDLIGEAAERLLRKRLGPFGLPVARHYKRLERRLLSQADEVVVISSDFKPFVPERARVIENWAPLHELPLRARINPWSTAHGLDRTTNLVYSGTLGMKHDPGLFVRIADTASDDTRMVVVSEGSAAEWLREQARTSARDNLMVLPFQPYENLADLHASADVLVAVLEPDAGVFSVPSKVLSYLCAGRALLLVVPRENLASRIIVEAGAGVVVEPGDLTELDEAVARLLGDPTARAEMGARARAYAERTFELSSIADRFEVTLHAATAHANRRIPRGVQNASVAADTDGIGRNRTHPLAATGALSLSIIMVSYNCRDVLRRCLTSLEAHTDTVRLEVLVVDNDSRDGTAALVEREFPWVRLIRNATNEGFASATNRALASAEGEHLLLLNPDTIVPPGALQATIAELDRDPQVGMVGCKLVQPDGTFDHACKRGLPTVSSALYYALGLQRLFPRSRRFAAYTAGNLDLDTAGTVGALNGAFMLVRREAVAEVGALDERFWLYGEDLDWCLRFREHGWGIRYWPAVEVVHLKGTSGRRTRRATHAFHRSMWLYYKKHLAVSQPRIVHPIVWSGIWARFALVSVANRFRAYAPSDRTS